MLALTKLYYLLEQVTTWGVSRCLASSANHRHLTCTYVKAAHYLPAKPTKASTRNNITVEYEMASHKAWVGSHISYFQINFIAHHEDLLLRLFFLFEKKKRSDIYFLI